MDEQHKDTTSNRSSHTPQDRADIAGLPIKQDTAVEISPTKEDPNKLEISAVKPIFHPPEIISEPIKRYWIWIWIVVIVLTIIAWAFLYAYFSSHQAPHSAPIR
ncbi:MAG: hypothetical protein ABI220_05650 [Candidatus Saccharimonadales bacterium]